MIFSRPSSTLRLRALAYSGGRSLRTDVVGWYVRVKEEVPSPRPETSVG